MVLIWMGVIFYFSSQVRATSNNLSLGVTEIVVKAVHKVVPKSGLDVARLNHIVRKNAHFFNYLLLGIFVINAIRATGVNKKKAIIWTLLICILYASSDEIHQMFVPGRGPQVKDVLIDTMGALVGLVIFMVINEGIKKRKKFKRNMFRKKI